MGRPEALRHGLHVGDGCGCGAQAEAAVAGGNHRVYIVLSGFIARESLDQLVAPFQKMADDLTPYYQERLRWISPQQRQIVELLCREHGTLNPKEIARRLLVTEQTIGKQVRKLAEIGYLNSTKRGRETFYELSEPLMRLAFEVKEQSLLEMLIDFLRIWYRPDQMREFQASGLCPTTQAYIDAAYERSQTHPDPRLKILQDEIEKAEAEGRSHELATLWEEKAAASNEASDWFTAGYYFGEINKDNEKEIDCYDKAIEIDPDTTYAWNNKGYSLANLGRHEEALSCYDKATEIDPKSAYPRFNRSETLFAMNRWEEGSESLRNAFEQSESLPEYLGDAASMWSLIFRLSSNDDALRSRVSTLVDIYQQASRPDQGAERHRSGSNDSAGQDETAGRALRSFRATGQATINPLAYLGDGLVRSLATIDADRVTSSVLESYVQAVEQRVAGIPEFEVPLRLFRYGIRYLISKDETEFVKLIQPERRILRQALKLPEEA